MTWGLRAAGASAEEVQKVANAGWSTDREVMEKSESQLRGVLGCDAARVKRLRVSLAKQMVTRPVSVLELQNERAFVASEFEELDAALGGGARRGTVTELVGRAGSGKTQCCSQAASACAFRGEVALYLDTENSFQPKRILQMARARSWPETILEQILIWRPRSSDELLEALRVGGEVERAAVERGAGLLVVDSVAALVRTDFATDELRDRQAWLATVSSSLKRVARLASLAVLVTNHIVADLESQNADKPALGLLWHHCVTTRLLFEPNVDRDAAPRTGRITVAKSPSVPEISVPYTIDACGLVAPS